jgi:hypothetical protein
MANASDIKWFKDNFSQKIGPKIQGTAITVDFLAALACQETGEVWPILRAKGLSVNDVLALCVGDTIDNNGKKGRQAFPLNKADLLSHPNGAAMFAIARQALVDMAKYISSYKGAAANPNKFCHAFGMFQYDLQFLDKAHDYFLKQQYKDFDIGLARCLGELHDGIKQLSFQSKPNLTDYELACVGIVYNTGHFNPKRGLSQGYFDGTKYYGKALFDYIRLAHTVADAAQPASLPAAPNVATIAAPTPVTSAGPIQVADTGALPLLIRSTPVRDKDDPNSNVIGEIPNGHPVAVNEGVRAKSGFTPVETSLLGAHLQGFAMSKFLSNAPAGVSVEVAQPAVTPRNEPPAAYAPIPNGVIIRRTKPAGPQSLNEPRQPSRSGTTPDELCASIAGIIEWLAVDDRSHVRYLPVPGKTFCNIYAHDYCYLAGVYLPRVWWNGPAIASFAKGQPVNANVGTTVDEQRANDLFRWLRDYGMDFGWRRTSTTTKLQTEVNQGAIGLIVARRKEDGKSGHIVAVVPETSDRKAKRDAAGNVTAPLQSQAGAINFQYGTGRANWWNGNQFAEFAFWLHA